MRPSLPPACAAFLLSCFFTLGCSGGAPFYSGAKTSPVPPPVTTPVTEPVTTPVGTPTSSSNPIVSVMISDSAACKAPNGSFSHIYVTIRDIQASTNADAAAGDASFVDLTPGLSSTPQQVDLLGQANSKCFLAALSVNQQVAAGNYQQVRIFFAPDSAASRVANNACGASYSNCLVRTDNSLHDLQLPAASAKGFRLSTTQIVNGSLTMNASEQPAVDLNFDTCSSILATADGGYEFNPVVHAGMIPTTGGSISGMVVSSATGHPLQGGHVVVALEQRDSSTGVDRILMRTTAGANGSFLLCPVPQGTYDVVVIGVDGSNVSYSAGIETGIQSGQMAGKIPLVPGSAQGLLQGMITTQSGGLAAAGIPVAVQADALQKLPDGQTITVPLLPNQNPYNAALLTVAGSTCPVGTDCGTFSMQLPANAPNVVACSEETAKFSQQADTEPTYIAASTAEIAGSGVSDCGVRGVAVFSTLQGQPLLAGPNQSLTSANLAFTQCE